MGDRRGRVRTLAGVLGAACLFVLGPGQVRSGWGAWVDQAPVGASYVATTVPAPTASCGLLQLSSTSLSWSEVAGATGYRLHYGLSGATTESVGPGVTSKSFTSVSTGTFWVEAEHSYGGNVWRSPISNKLTYTVVLAAVGSCLPG